MLINLIVGSVCILIGVWIFIFTYRNPDSQLKSLDLKGYIAGIGFIILGIMCLIGKGGDLVDAFR